MESISLWRLKQYGATTKTKIVASAENGLKEKVPFPRGGKLKQKWKGKQLKF